MKLTARQLACSPTYPSQRDTYCTCAMAKPNLTLDHELYKLGGMERVREMIRREKESHGEGIEVGFLLGSS